MPPQLDVLELMASGGMGLVYRARQKNLDREVALKILPVDAHDDPALPARFVSEAQILASLHHPNIVMALEAGQVDGWLYLVMELVAGPNLREVLKCQGALKPRGAMTIALQLCDALAYAHDRQVIHRDIKPENILLDSAASPAGAPLGNLLAQGGLARLADFGLAKLLSRSARDVALTAPHEYLGTADYIAPECRRGKQVADASGDIYALGVVLYEMLTGQIPAGHFAPPSRLAGVDRRVDAIVLRCLAADPADRYPSVVLLRRDLAGAMHGRQRPRGCGPPAGRMRHRRGRAGDGSPSMGSFVARSATGVGVAGATGDRPGFAELRRNSNYPAEHLRAHARRHRSGPMGRAVV